MSRSEGEEADEPVTGGERVVRGGPSGPSPNFTVVISGDGSAAVDGAPVPVTEGKAVDAAILDLLHEHARDRDTTVTASISDPAAGYVAFVEVSPDGSSSLLEQRQEAPAPSLAKGRAAATGTGAEAEADGTDPAPDGGDEAAYALPEPEGTPTGTPAARPVPPPAPARRTAARQSDDEFEGPGLLSRPLVVGPVALGVAALVVVPLVILGSGGSGDGGNREQAAARVSGSPSAEASPTLSPLPIPPPPASPSPKEKDEHKDKAKDKSKDKPKPTGTAGAKGPGGAAVTVTARPPAATTTVTARPPQDTAAHAVKRLAASDPSGRHICYRAYVSGQGWQKPVCDGTIAGTSGQNRPIKALNIAVHGVDGSAANAFRHTSKPVDGRGRWQPSWTAVTGDGRNFSIGTAKQNAPNMLGFAMNVGSGEICNTVRLRHRDWSGRACSKPRPDFTFGGTLDNDVWLEAVKLTV
jgi:hypothetical protein